VANACKLSKLFDSVEEEDTERVDELEEEEVEELIPDRYLSNRKNEKEGKGWRREEARKRE
jgi:hypothetical protein